MNNKSTARLKIKYRIRKKISGVSEKPRLSVFRSNGDIYAQLIDDVNGQTIASASSRARRRSGSIAARPWRFPHG